MAFRSLSAATSSPSECLTPTKLHREQIYTGLMSSRKWGLPPTQHLHNTHIRAALLPKPLPGAVDDLDESFGLVSGDAYNREEYDDSSDEESDHYSADSSPPGISNVNEPFRSFDHNDNVNDSSYKSRNGVNLVEAYGTDKYYYECGRTYLKSRPHTTSISRSSSTWESFGHLEGREAQAMEKAKHSQQAACNYEDSEERNFYFNTRDCSGAESSGHDERYHGQKIRGNIMGVQINGVANSWTGYDHSSSTVHRIDAQHGQADKDPCAVEAHPQNYSDNISVPPSAPPMTGSIVMETSIKSDDSIPVHSASQSKGDGLSADSKEDYDRQSETRTSFSFETVQMHSGHFPEQDARVAFGVSGKEAGTSFPKKVAAIGQPPAAHLSGNAAWQAVISYDACVRLCLRAWARGCMEAPEFLRDECSVLRNAFGLHQLLLQPQALMQRTTADNAEASSAFRLRKDVGKIKVQVRKVKIMFKMTPRCSFPSFPFLRTTHAYADSSNIRSALLAGWATVKKVHVLPQQVLRGTSLHGAPYVLPGAQYIRQVSGLLKTGVNTLRNTAMPEKSQESYSCILKLRSTQDEEAVIMQPGSGETHVFYPESSTDDLMLEIQNSRGAPLGQVLVQLVSLSDDLNDQVRWWPIFNELDNECVGKVQLCIGYTITSGEDSLNMCSPVGETLAYDIVLEVAMRAQHFQPRNLHLCEPWRWLLSEFSLYYGVRDTYTKLRYLVCIMEVATPTKDCLVLIYHLLLPVVKDRDSNLLNRLEKRILIDVQEQIEQLLALVFENYKSLDESSSTGLTNILSQAVGKAAPALVPAVQIFTLLHDILSSEAQMMLHNYFQTAAKKRCRHYMKETDEFVSSNNEGFLMDPITIATAYMKMKYLCMYIGIEVHTDIEIYNQHILPSSIDLPNIAAGIYSVELCNRLRAFLAACPPSGPSPPVTDLLLATADFQRDLTSWRINTIKGGVDAKDLFDLYVMLWIQDKRLHLLDFCKVDKVRWTGVTTQHGTSPFVEEMHERIKDALNEYEIITTRWPEYTLGLEAAVADIETAMISALEKQYVEVLAPLKEVMVPKKFTFQYMQKLTRRRSLSVYSVPNQLGVFMNTVKRLLDTLLPILEVQMKHWVSCLPVEGGGKGGFGEQLNGITVILRAKYKTFLQAIVEKLADNACLQPATNIKKVLKDMREAAGLSDIRDRTESIKTQLIDTINHLHDVFASRVFVAVCRGYWDRMGRDFLCFLENRKENKSWYKGLWFALAMLDNIFASQMQKLQGHSLQEKDLEPPHSIMEARSMLSKDEPNGLDSSNYYYF